MRKELEKQQKIYSLFQESKAFISKLGISRQNIQYYADICNFYEPYQLRGFSTKKSRLCMLCFIWQLFLKINDHLVTYYVHKTHVFEGLASAYTASSIMELKTGINKDRKLASRMLKIVIDDGVMAEDIQPKCYGVVCRDHFETFTNTLASPEIDKSA